MLLLQAANALPNTKEFKVNARNCVQPIVKETLKAGSAYAQQAIYLMDSINVFPYAHLTATSTRHPILAFVIPIIKCLMEHAAHADKELLMMYLQGHAWLSSKGKLERQAQ